MKAFPCEWEEYDPDYEYIITGKTFNDITPIEKIKGKWVKKESAGMDLRDYFAAKALTGLLTEANCDYEDSAIAELAYSVADAMMKAREQ